jgi:hypothetical protein
MFPNGLFAFIYIMNIVHLVCHGLLIWGGVSILTPTPPTPNIPPIPPAPTIPTTLPTPHIPTTEEIKNKKKKDHGIVMITISIIMILIILGAFAYHIKEQSSELSMNIIAVVWLAGMVSGFSNLLIYFFAG